MRKLTIAIMFILLLPGVLAVYGGADVGASSSSSSSGGGGGSTPVATTCTDACSPIGAIKCIGQTTYNECILNVCNEWSSLKLVSPGTECVNNALFKVAVKTETAPAQTEPVEPATQPAVQEPTPEPVPITGAVAAEPVKSNALNVTSYILLGVAAIIAVVVWMTFFMQKKKKRRFR